MPVATMIVPKGTMASKPKDSVARDVYLNLVRVHEELSGQFSALFKRHGLTQAQFNVLRILLGGAREGVSCNAIGERLLNRVPDVTRLVDRMEAAGLVKRIRGAPDRRVVLVRISAKGRRLCEELDGPVMDLHRRQLAHMSSREVEALDRSLVRVLNRS